MNKILVLLIATVFSVLTYADIYQWTDESGKVHFSDKPPRNQQAENITDQTKHINQDSGAREREKMADLFAPPTAEEQRYEQQQAQGATQAQLEKEKYCENLRKELKFFTTQRFYWVDEDGNPSNATEVERKEMIKKLEQTIQKNC